MAGGSSGSSTSSGSPSPLATPKSSSLGKRRSPDDTTMTFDGLRSRWTMPSSWAACTTSHSATASGANSSIGIGPRSRTSAPSVCPRTSSIAIHRRPSGSAPNA